jgi:protein-tyrosine phosphatase
MSPWLDERQRNGGIDEVPVPGRGRLWLCGKHFIGPDPEVALERTGAAVVVCLNERSELEDRYPEYVDWLLHTAADRAIWFPLHDMHAPPLDEVQPLFAEIARRLDEDEGVIVHCGAGVGRAGTVAAALLMRRGLSLDDALSTVASSRPMAGPQTLAQALFLEELAASG